MSPTPILVTGALGCEGVLGEVRATDDRPVLALIAHGRDGILQLGSWIVDTDETEGTELAKRWDALGGWRPTKIWLLGCCTGSALSAPVLTHLEEVMGPDVEIQGADTILGADCFDRYGLIPGAQTYLRQARDISQPLVAGDVEAWFKAPWLRQHHVGLSDLVHLLKRETHDIEPAIAHTLADLQAMLSRASPFAVSTPGLLAIPDHIRLVKIAANTYVRIEEFLHGAFIRVYPAGYDDGLLLRGDPSTAPPSTLPVYLTMG